MAGYIDLQVNGYAGVDFNADDLAADALHAACERLRADGVERILATVITEAEERMARRLGRLAELRERDPLVGRVVAGLHVEGPFVSADPGFAGAHPADRTRDACESTMARLCDAGRGLVRLVTLAPERDPGARLVGWLAARDIRVAAGHTDASRDQLAAAIDAGLSMFTHLGNGCPRVLPRHDNIVQRALSFADRLWTCFIADGAHVPFFALANYLRIVTPARAIVVTDAIAAAGLGPGRYTLGGRSVLVGDDLLARHEVGDHLVGSTATFPRVAAALRAELGLGQHELDLLCRANALSVLGP
jgi:N-acetylglucosamine-6-phosphate deacetylase